MVYKVIGLMSGSSLDGLDIAFVQFQETGGKWSYEIIAADCYEYDESWINELSHATDLNARDYLLLDARYGQYLGKKINYFIEQNDLHHQVNLISSHGHTTFHEPGQLMTAQLGSGAAIAAATRLPVVSDLRALDVSFGGEGAPIVPIGEKLLFSEYDYFLNLGGIANISIKEGDTFFAFDICPANRVLNMLAEEKKLLFDKDGKMAASGKVNEELLKKLNTQEYYHLPFPKSLPNTFGVEIIYPLVKSSGLPAEDAMRTYVEHICIQVKNAITSHPGRDQSSKNRQLLVTGGGAFNIFLIGRLKEAVHEMNIEIIIPDAKLIKFKEALVMGLIGVLRWREEYNILASVTGAQQNSISGALWLGTEA